MSEYAEELVSLLAHSQVVLLSEVHLCHSLHTPIVKTFKSFDIALEWLHPLPFRRDLPRG
ncbi:hypothetical protein TSIB_0876 [Thermococcus sibiricus MM 739]|uniref:Uncharacterized protein n=1 Tax=Thermococcus sibiricus (strain DSM 12597 / MM 739) TaxID=604354 RepID=C6A2C3_THESM|nr:hypothetical protein TSIB_0704 [Thermococcus sibiricus MM 739]ACS89936.1 hypothetical protein TSIB_0876 [Thermococcus sibiricus MM 739]